MKRRDRPFTIKEADLSAVLRALALWIWLAAPALADSQGLRNFAILMGLAQIGTFVETIETIRETGYLPDYYITKRKARDWGWHPGDDLCDVADGYVIGGDRFGNRERRLPEGNRRRWTEADLDFDCGRRGAKRLVFSNDGLIYVTIDHYDSFTEVPQ